MFNEEKNVCNTCSESIAYGYAIFNCNTIPSRWEKSLSLLIGWWCLRLRHPIHDEFVSSTWWQFSIWHITQSMRNFWYNLTLVDSVSMKTKHFQNVWNPFHSTKCHSAQCSVCQIKCSGLITCRQSAWVPILWAQSRQIIYESDLYHFSLNCFLSLGACYCMCKAYAPRTRNYPVHTFRTKCSSERVHTRSKITPR